MSEPTLDDDERAYLAAFHEVHTPSPTATQASLTRVQERLAAGAVVEAFDEASSYSSGDASSDDSSDDSSDSSGDASDDASSDTSDEVAESGPSRLRPLWVLGVTAVAIAAMVALLMRLDVTAWLASETVGEDPAEAIYAGHESEGAEGEAIARVRASGRAHMSRPNPAATEPEEVSPPEPEAELPPVEPPSVEPLPVEPPPERRRPRAAERTPANEPTSEPASEPPPAADATLHAEIALLRPAQKALRSGDYARALRLLDDHAKSFPRSVLAEERSLGRIKALCGLGRKAEARRMIDAFGRKHPGSPLAGRVEQACPAGDTP